MTSNLSSVPDSCEKADRSQPKLLIKSNVQARISLTFMGHLIAIGHVLRMFLFMQVWSRCSRHCPLGICSSSIFARLEESSFHNSVMFPGVNARRCGHLAVTMGVLMMEENLLQDISFLSMQLCYLCEAATQIVPAKGVINIFIGPHQSFLIWNAISFVFFLLLLLFHSCCQFQTSPLDALA